MTSSTLPEFSPEFGLLLACALHPLQRTEISSLQSACRREINWQGFSALVGRHRLLPTIYSNLSRHAASAVPQPVLTELKAQAGLNRQRVLQNLAVLRRISQWFAQENIPLCTLKGPLLSLRLFGDVALRTSADLDLLVESNDLAQADALLLSHGCRRVLPDVSLKPRQWHAFQRQWYNSTYLFPRPQMTVELHWAIASPDLISSEVMAQVLARARPVNDSDSLLALADEDLPVSLLAHGAKHNWARLKWLVDFVIWIRGDQNPDWTALQSHMATLGLERILGQGLLLAHWLFNCSIPVELEPLLASEPAARRLALRSLQAILDPNFAGIETDTRDKIRLTLYRLQLKGSLRYKLATLIRLVRPWLWMRSYYLRLHRDKLAATPHRLE